MIALSMSSVMMSVVFSNLLLLVLYLIFRKTTLMMDIGYKLLKIFLAITLFRFLMPFEILITTNIFLPEKISRIITDAFLVPHISLGGTALSVWQLFLVLWGIGILVQSFRLLQSYRKLRRRISRFATDISDKEPYQTLLHTICQERSRKNVFRIYELPGIFTPMIYGLKAPCILLPEAFRASEKDIYYILSHEAAHFFHHDLWLKLFSQLLCVFYWWNPLVLLLQRQISTILELNVDLYLTSSTNPRCKAEYLECLLNTARAQISHGIHPALSFCTAQDSLLRQRFLMLTDNPRKNKNRQIQLLFSFAVVALYTFSVFFIFEPSSVSPEVEMNSFEITPENAYFIENPNGGYDLYLDGSFLITTSFIDDSLSNLTIYKSTQEVTYE